MHGNKFANVLMSPPVQSTSPVHWSSPVIVDRHNYHVVTRRETQGAHRVVETPCRVEDSLRI